jgi:hypothetical protein
MASLLNKDDPADVTQSTTTATPTTVSTDTASGTSGATSGGTGTGGSATTVTNNINGNASQPVTSSPQEDTQKAVSLNQNLDFSPLLNTIQSQGTTARNAVGYENNQFNTRLGTTPTFGTDQQNLLSSVLQGSTPLDQGTNLLNTTSKVDGIANANYDPLVSQYSTNAGLTGDSNGISTLLSNLQPQLTPGDRAYDAMIYSQNPFYQQQSRNLISDAADVTGLAGTTTTNASNALTQRATDVNAFNTAGNAYVTSQRDAINNALNSQMTTAQQNEINLQNALAGLRNGSLNTSDISRGQLAFDPASYTPQDVKGVYDTTFDRVIDPRQYLSYQSGMLPTRGNMATADQATQYNNAEQLLNDTDRLTTGPYTGGTLNINQSALYEALRQAQSARDAADAAWLYAHTPAPVPATTGGGGVYTENNTGGHEGEAGGGGDAGAGGMGGGDEAGGGGEEAGGAEAGGDNGMGAESQGGANEAGGEAEAGGAEGAEGEGGAATGGLIKAGRVFPSGRMPKGLQKGGYIPKNAGPPGKDTLHNIALNNGEFVVKAPSVVAIGPTNMAGLNKVASLPAAREAAVRNALHQALTRAALGAK